MSDREGILLEPRRGSVPVRPGQLRKWDDGEIFIVIGIIPSLRQETGFRRWQIIVDGVLDWDFDNNIEASSEVIGEAR